MWLSLRLPQLPLEVLFTQAITDNAVPVLNNSPQNPSHARAQAVIANNRIIALNQSALQSGIKINQSLSSVYALCDSIQILERNLAQEQQAINNLALLLYSYSPCVAIKNEQLLTVEIARSLKLYKGLENLLAKLRQELDLQNYSYSLAIGHSPKSAEIFTRLPSSESIRFWQTATQTIDTVNFYKKLEQLPVALMEIPEKPINKIHSVGINSIAELKQLPLSAIRKRFGEIVSRYLTQLFSQTADLQNYFIPPLQFSQHLEFIDVIHHRQSLLFPIKRIIQDLCRFLTLQQKYCQHLSWTLFDSEKNSIKFDVLLTDNQVNSNLYLELTQLNLERHTLYAPIQSIKLKALQLNHLNLINQTLFTQTESFQQNPAFISKIQAKLGKQSCYRAQQRAVHIPELASAQCHQINSQPVKSVDESNGLNDSSKSMHNNRPGWLFEKPLPIFFNQGKLIWRGELKIISSAERITAHWWDKKLVRDYFVAEHNNGSLYWIFYDKLQQQWFVHGVYG